MLKKHMLTISGQLPPLPPALIGRQPRLQVTLTTGLLTGPRAGSILLSWIVPELLLAIWRAECVCIEAVKAIERCVSCRVWHVYTCVPFPLPEVPDCQGRLLWSLVDIEDAGIFDPACTAFVTSGSNRPSTGCRNSRTNSSRCQQAVLAIRK